MIAHYIVQPSAQTFIHNVIVFIDTSKNGVFPKSDALPDRPLSFLYHLCLKQSVPWINMHDWFCQIELIESIWQNKAELRENSNKFIG